MATSAQAQEIIQDLNEKVARFTEAVDALTEASGNLSQPALQTTPPPAQPSESGDRDSG